MIWDGVLICRMPDLSVCLPDGTAYGELNMETNVHRQMCWDVGQENQDDNFGHTIESAILTFLISPLWMSLLMGIMLVILL